MHTWQHAVPRHWKLLITIKQACCSAAAAKALSQQRVSTGGRQPQARLSQIRVMPELLPLLQGLTLCSSVPRGVSPSSSCRTSLASWWAASTRLAALPKMAPRWCRLWLMLGWVVAVRRPCSWMLLLPMHTHGDPVLFLACAAVQTSSPLCAGSQADCGYWRELWCRQLWHVRAGVQPKLHVCGPVSSSFQLPNTFLWLLHCSCHYMMRLVQVHVAKHQDLCDGWRPGSRCACAGKSGTSGLLLQQLLQGAVCWAAVASSHCMPRSCRLIEVAMLLSQVLRLLATSVPVH